jgi:hypothetical protein
VCFFSGLIVLEWQSDDASFFDVHWRLVHNAFASLVAREVRKRVFLRHLHRKNDHFTKTGSGQT